MGKKNVSSSLQLYCIPGWKSHAILRVYIFVATKRKLDSEKRRLTKETKISFEKKNSLFINLYFSVDKRPCRNFETKSKRTFIGKKDIYTCIHFSIYPSISSMVHYC